MNLLTFQQFVDWALSQGSVAKYNDGQYPGECVSLINQYCWRVLDVPADAWGHAKDWGVNQIQKEYFHVLPRSTQIKEGDILVYDEQYGNGLGHIEIALNSEAAIYQNRNFNGLIGTGPILPNYYVVLRSKEDTMNKETVTFAYRLGWNREPSAKELDYWVGKKASELLPAIYYSNHDFRYGAIHYKDMTKQIDELQKALSNASQALTNAQQSGATNVKELEKVKAENASLAEKYNQVATEQEKDKQAGESFIRRIGQLITKYLPK